MGDTQQKGQTNLLAALQDRLQALQADVVADAVSIATVTDEIEDLEYEIRQNVPYKLTSEESMEH